MREVPYRLSVPATATTDLTASGAPAVGVGIPQRCRDLDNKVVEVTGSFTGTVKVQLKVVNAYLPYATTLTAPGLIPVSVAAEWLAIDVTGVASGAPVCALRGLDTRSAE